uniref:Uncharacterized protein n=1 Tax=Terrapene triunguis TaxID=2587831 RepID=A0A674JQ88_9SAUR
MATAPSGPRRIRTNPFSSSSSSFCSKAEGRASASLCCCCCCGGELACPSPSPCPHTSPTPPDTSLTVPSHLASPRPQPWCPPPFPAGLTRSVSTSRRVWLSCFSSSAILAIDSFSASWSFSVSCKRSHTSHWPNTGTAGTKATSPPVPELGGARGMEEQPWNPSPLSGHRDTLSTWQRFPAHTQISSCRRP